MYFFSLISDLAFLVKRVHKTRWLHGGAFQGVIRDRFRHRFTIFYENAVEILQVEQWTSFVSFLPLQRPGYLWRSTREVHVGVSPKGKARPRQHLPSLPSLAA